MCPKRKPSRQTHHYLREAEAGVLNGQEVARAALSLKNAGFIPDVMLGHNSWGEIWHLKDIYPHVPLVGYFEFFYRTEGADVEFDPGVSEQLDTAPRIRTKNVGNLLGLDAADLAQCLTRWQQSLRVGDRRGGVESECSRELHRVRRALMPAGAIADSSGPIPHRLYRTPDRDATAVGQLLPIRSNAGEMVCLTYTPKPRTPT